MKAAILTEKGFHLEDVAQPTLGPEDVLIKTVACGVCSGDVFVYQERHRLAPTHSQLGHEGSGVVAAVGAGVTAFKQGEVVTALGMPAYADYYLTGSSNVVKLAPDIDPELALGEAIACCVHAANRFGIQPGDKVALVGCGFMGLICQQLAAYQGKGSGFICSFDLSAERREMSRRFGAQVSYDPRDVSSAEILAKHGEFDVVIEAAGVQSALDLSTELVAQHGRIVLIGYHQSNSGLRTVNMQQWNYKALDVINGHVRRQAEKVAAMREGMRLLRAGHIVTEPLVTTYDFADIEQAFRDLTHNKPGLFKAVLRM